MGKAFYRAKRRIEWHLPGRNYARQRTGDNLAFLHAKHGTPMLRALSGVDMQLQRNKMDSLRIAASCIDGIVLNPGETFSFWRMVGKPSLGRGFKVGKEEVCGLIAALKAYVVRDFPAEAARLAGYADEIVAGLSGIRGVEVRRVDGHLVPGAMGRPGPHVEVVLGADAGLSGADLVNRLQAADPMVCTWEGKAFQNQVRFYPDGLADGEAAEIVAAAREALRA